MLQPQGVTIRRTSLLLPVVAAIALTGCTAAPVPAPASTGSMATRPAPYAADPVGSSEGGGGEQGRTFLQLLDERGLHYTSAAAVIDLGRTVCANLAHGDSTTELAGLVQEGSAYTAAEARWLIDAARRSFCP